jgi:formylglycine-generating enzyme required for sulfatase activity
MKKILISILVCTIPFFLQAQNFYGMSKVEDNLWVDNTEITVNEYRQFINALPEDKKKDYLPDTSVVTAIDSSLARFYFTHPAYDDYPIVGISFSQAIGFCGWRSELYNSTHKEKVRFMLPSMTQWLKLSYYENVESSYAGNIQDPVVPNTKQELKYFKKNGFLSNCANCRDTNLPFTISAEHCYGHKLKGLAGNVAEMTFEGYVIGGSWFHKDDFCKKDRKIPQQSNVPTAWMGFRFVLSIIEN